MIILVILLITQYDLLLAIVLLVLPLLRLLLVFRFFVAYLLLCYINKNIYTYSYCLLAVVVRWWLCEQNAQAGQSGTFGEKNIKD